jgi:nitrogen fixation/metabolism regulation signal transduction histidine kinase
MDFNKFNVKILARLLGILVTMYFLVSLWVSDAYFLTILLFAILLAIQIYALYNYLNKTNEEVLAFLDSIKYDDLSLTYSTDGDSSAIDQLNKEFNKVMDRFKEIRREKEADAQYMRNIVQHVGIGIITFNNSGNIQLINATAKKLLRVNQLSNVEELESINPELVEVFLRLRTGGRDLVKLEIGGEIIQLAIYAIELTLRGEEFKLVSIQNIQTELEEQEMDAWQNLVRVLTHEIMNSVTPISSLAGTVESELNHYLTGKDDSMAQMSREDMQDLYQAVDTIQKRSQGLIRFVQDFRNLTHIPKPKLAVIPVQEMLKDIEVLLATEINDNNITYTQTVEPKTLSINVDKALIEQVLINLIKNAIQSFDEETNCIVEVKAFLSEKGRPTITVADNGSGIDEEALEKIFIPFFTTKKRGSGIGLSLSRQIMRKHQGILAVKTKIDEGTEFMMRF